MTKQTWIESSFPQDQKVDEVWKRWAETNSDSSQELVEIVYEPYQMPYQKRALFLLLAPTTQLAPFFWKHPESSHYYLDYRIDFKRVDTTLRAYAVEWLTKFIDFVRFKYSTSNHKAIILDAYNNYVLQLLAILPAEDNEAETVFSYFSINDTIAWNTIDLCSGYNPLLNLWKNPLINEKWKKIADSSIRQIIQDELRGDSVPRQAHENALGCYVKHIQSILPRLTEFLPYSKEFLANQINFISSLEISDQQLIGPEFITLVLNILNESNFKNTCEKFVRFAVLRDGRFKVYSDQTEESAKLILKTSNDKQIIKEITDLLVPYQDRERISEQRERDERMAKEALLAPMRKTADIPLSEDQSEQ